MDEYIEREPLKKKIEKDSLLLLVSVSKVNEGKNRFWIGIMMYRYNDYPIVDTLKTYKGIKILTSFSKEKKEELSKYFNAIKDDRKKDRDALTTLFPSYCNYTFMINGNNEIYFIMTNMRDDQNYYKKLKKKGLKFSKDLKLSKDMY